MTVKEAYEKAKAYIAGLAPEESLFYEARESYTYYIFDFLPNDADENTKGCLLSGKTGYTCMTYGTYGPVLVSKYTGECLANALDEKSIASYRNLIERSKMIPREEVEPNAKPVLKSLDFYRKKSEVSDEKPGDQN